MYSNASGSVLVVRGARKGWTAGILRGDRYTPLPWDRHIATAILVAASTPGYEWPP